MILNLYRKFLSTPLQGFVMGAEVEIDSIPAFDGAATILDTSPAPARYIYSGTEGVISGIGSNGTIFRQERPGQNA